MDWGVDRASGEQVEGVGKEGENGGQGGLGSVYAAGEVDDEAAACSAADGSAERGERSVEKTGGTHTLGEAVDEFVADEAGGFGSDIAGGKAGSSSGDNELRRGCMMAKSSRYLFQLIGEDGGFYVVDACGLEEPKHGWA